MTEKQSYLGDVRSAKLAISKIDGLAMLSVAATETFEQMLDSGFSPVALAHAVEMSPALAVKVLSLAHSRGLKAADHHFSFAQILERLPADALRNAILEIELWDEAEQEDPGDARLSRATCVQHSLAVAHASRLIAQAMVVGTDANLAFMVGLLHDIGKLALHELMPKGFAAIVGQAEMSGVGSCVVEREYLGLDHATLGKYLARKWYLPAQIETGIWLHHSHVVRVNERLPDTNVARIVFCADCLVRSIGLGFSGSFDPSPDVDELAGLVRIKAKQLQGVREQLESSADLEERISRLSTPVSARQLVSVTRRLAQQLGLTQSQQDQEHARLRRTEQELGFVRDMYGAIDVRQEPAEFCVQWAKQWQRFFQTSKVCLFLMPNPQDQFVETFIVAGLMECTRALLDKPAQEALVPKTLAAQPGIYAVQGAFDWLFDQLEFEFNPAQTKFMPLLFDGGLLGGLVFELGHPSDTDEHASLFSHLEGVGSTLLHAVLARQYHEALSDEVFALTAFPQAQDGTGRNRLIGALTELAAGFAHELNNPLSVVAGRIQLLIQDETDEEKQRILRQIEENAHEISVILDDLISYAEPSPARPSRCAVGQIIDEAVQLAQHKLGRDDWSISIHTDQTVAEVFVDSAQIASALANVLVNGVEACRDDMGAIEIFAKASEAYGHVELQVRDHGCGMDQGTLEKAMTPFFSSKSAGRQRGMGIAYAARIVELNRGHFSIHSRLNEGTTATFRLPTGAEIK